MLSYKYYAKRAVAEAIRKNMMSPAREFACTACPLMDPPNDPPNQAQLYHHLLGYEPENWLEVQPLCRGCHEFLHPKDE